MNIDSFDWDDGNVRHIARHHVDPGEAEEVFEAWYLLVRTRAGRYAALGQTAAGRYLSCIFERTDVPGMIRIATARDMDRAERKRYKREKPS